MNRAMTICRQLLALVAASLMWLSASPGMAQQSTPIAGVSAQSENVAVTLLSARASVAPGETVTLAIRQVIGDGWHTYWRNPGDSGDATRVNWTLPDGASAGPLQWPRPQAQPFGPLVNYGYSDTVILPVEVSLPDSARAGSVVRLEAAVSWLECSDVCIPGDATVAIMLPVAASGTDGPDAALIAQALTKVPTPLAMPATIAADGANWTLAVTSPAFADVTRAQFFPYEVDGGALIDFAAPQTLKTGPQGLSISILKSGSSPAALTAPVGGVIVTGEGDTAEAFDISFTPGATPAGVADRQIAVLDPKQTGKASSASNSQMTLIQAVLFAFIGGLILNLMPCVFPILAMKGIGLMQAAHGDLKEARAHGLLYGLGVMVTFLGLAGLLIGLKAGGAALGWGFQLQEPLVVLALVALLVLISLNLLGVFEFAGSFQSIGSDASHKQDRLGAFLTGVLAVVVASPCTAPFMGAALGYGLTQSAGVALAVFAGLGAGFALPFMLVTFVPAIMKALPRPGAWMVRFKQIMALPMFATAIWLAWVLGNQAGLAGWAGSAVAVIAAGAVAIGLGQVKGGMVKTALIAGAVVALGASGLALAGAQPPQTNTRAGLPEGAEVWTPGRAEALQAQGKTVFVNFTADWCVSCKVNEAGIFSDRQVVAALTEDDTVWLVADWTRRDSDIASALSSHGRSGVPLYLVYQPGKSEPEILPQLPDRATVLDALQ